MTSKLGPGTQLLQVQAALSVVISHHTAPVGAMESLHESSAVQRFSDPSTGVANCGAMGTENAFFMNPL